MSNKMDKNISDVSLDTDASNKLLETLKRIGVVEHWRDFRDGGVQVKRCILRLYETSKLGDIDSFVTNTLLWEVLLRDLLCPTLNESSKNRLITHFSIQCNASDESMHKTRTDALKYIQLELI